MADASSAIAKTSRWTAWKSSHNRLSWSGVSNRVSRTGDSSSQTWCG